MNKENRNSIEVFRQLKREIRQSERYLIVGIDVAKHKHHAFFGTAGGQTIHKRLIVENNASGFEHLLEFVQLYMNTYNRDRVVFGVEPTSSYHKPLAEFLITNGYLVVYATSEAVKNNRKLLDGRWDKNDTKDAANVADLISQGKCQYYDLPQMALRDIRGLLLLRKRLKKQEHGIGVRIRNNLVAQYFPELDRHWSKSKQEMLSIVKWCLAPEKIDQLEFKEFFDMVATGNRGKGQYDRLTKIWEIAPHSIGCKAGSAVELEAKVLVDGLRYVREQVTELDRLIKALCEQFPSYRFLLTIPGFGPYVSAMVLGAIGDPNRFENQKQVLKLAGLDLNASRSGQTSASAVPVISKKGKAGLRYALYQAALIASFSHPVLMKYFVRSLKGRDRERGIKTKMRVKLSAKLLVIAWTLMKRQEAFNANYVCID